MVYAHRGGAALRPENTIAAFDHGLALGANGLELDVRLSRDGVVVVHHDPTIERTTGGRGRVSDLTADELARLDAGCRFEPSRGLEGEAPAGGRDGLAIPRLSTVLSRYPGVPIIIEMKLNTSELATRVIDEVRAADALDRVSLGSFYQTPVLAARRYEPRIRTGATPLEIRWALYCSWLRLAGPRPRYDEFQVPERSGRTAIVTRRFVAEAHRRGIPLMVWTVNDAADMRRLIDWGVDAIITDRPDLAVGLARAGAR